MQDRSVQSSQRLSQLLALALLTGVAAHAQTSPAPAPEEKRSTIDVTVSAERAAQALVEQAGTTTVINATSLERQGAKDMGEAVRYQPLVNAPKAPTGTGNVWDGSGYSGYNIRGIEGNRVSLDLDGVPQPDAAPKPDGNTMNSFGVGRDYTDPENYQTIEISSGTTSSTRGSPGLGGGVSFVTKSPADYLGRNGRPYYLGYKGIYSSVDESFGNTFTGAAEYGALQALVVYTHRDGSETDTKGSTTPNPIDWKSDALLAKAVWKGANGHELEFSVDHFKREMDIIANNKASTLYIGGVTQHALSERFTLGLTHRFRPETPVALFDEITTKLYSQDAVTTDRTIAPNYLTGGISYRRDLLTKFNNDSFGLNSDAIKRIGDFHRLSYGITASEVESSRPWTEVRSRVSDGVVTQAGTKDRMPAMKSTKFAAYFNDEIGFTIAGRKATVTPGVRFETIESKPEDLSRYIVSVPGAANEIKPDTETSLVPSLAFNLSLTNTLDVYATYKQGVRVPTPVEKTGTYDSFSYTGGASGYAVLGNAGLKKETSDSFEVGLRSQTVRGVTFQLSAFYSKYEDYIEYVKQPFDPITYPTVNQLLIRPENVGEAEIYGWESSAKVDLGAWNSGLTGFSANLALGRANSSATNDNTGVKSRLGSVGPFKGSLTLAYDAPSKRFGAALTTTRIDGQQPPPDIMTASTAAKFSVPGVTLVDFSVYYHLTRNLAINAGVYNLTDEKYWDYYNARGLSAATTVANLAEIERYVQPGANGFISLSLSF